MSGPLAIVGLGCVSPVGLSAPATCAALRAGIARLKELQTYTVEGELSERQPVVGGRVPSEWFAGPPEEEEWPGHDKFKAPHPPALDELVASGGTRLIELAVPAAREAWLDAGFDVAPPKDWGLYLAVGEQDDPNPVAQAVEQAIGAPSSVRSFETSGRAGTFLALERAVADLSAKKITAALVGGVDSLIREEVLARLDEAEILRSAGRPQGVMPGEAAAFLVLARADGLGQRKTPPLGLVLSAARTEEPTAGTDEPNKGQGLSEAIRAARKAAPLSRRPLTICDLNGDRYRGLEWSIAMLRTMGDLRGDAPLWHPADCVGDTGAAAGALSLTWAITALFKGYATADRALVWGASDGRERAAAILASAPGRVG